MRKNGFAVAVVVLILSIFFCHGEEAKKSDGDWVQLFNGKDLSGWIPKIKGYAAGENFGNTFRVEDGVIKVSYD